MLSEGKIKISELKPHPQNNFYFDDMEGDAWDSLLQSISTSNVTNAITITQNKVIISGHQRIRACKVLGIEEVSYKMIEYENENQEIKDLIESNLRQRVLGNTNPVKLGRCFSFLNDWYGFEKGINQYSMSKVFTSSNEYVPSNQTELAESYGITKQTMNNYMRMASMIPELEDLVDTGIVTKDTALAIIRNLSSDEQRELIASLDITKKITKKEAKEYIKTIKELKAENKELKDASPDSLTISTLKIEKEQLEKENKILESQKKISDDLAAEYKSQSEEYMKVKEKLAHMGTKPNGDYNTFNAAVKITELNSSLMDLLQNQLAPLKYQQYIYAIKENKILRTNLISTLHMLNDWYETMLSYLGEETNDENIIDIEMEEKI
jgi:ParB-like chromosome segregation protein Spo0J|nr:MAG TPA: chromosome partitioning protein [Bacteriophage sp.]DAV23340.1 MAG TPA: chromosome partitioning protein [Bacteriophage sp.]